MKTKNLLILLMLAFVLKANVASAFLDSNLGRWIQRDPIGERGDINLYSYVGNNPINNVDPFGLKIEYANHPVVPGIYHSIIIITPDNQTAYANDPYFQNFDSNGKRYETIGAGPSLSPLPYGDLISGEDRKKDISDPAQNRRTLSIPCKYKNEDDAISALRAMNDAYNSDPENYVLFPDNSFNKNFGDPGYNSNSYISGLGTAAGFNMNFNTGAFTPGYNFPVPRGDFGP